MKINIEQNHALLAGHALQVVAPQHHVLLAGLHQELGHRGVPAGHVGVHRLRPQPGPLGADLLVGLGQIETGPAQLQVDLVGVEAGLVEPFGQHAGLAALGREGGGDALGLRSLVRDGVGQCSAPSVQKGRGQGEEDAGREDHSHPSGS